MGKNYTELGNEIVSLLGGTENITKLYHCATRLRVQLKDMKACDLEKIKGLNSVMGAVVSAGGVQVIIGNDVAKVYDAIVKNNEISSEAEPKSNSSDGKEKQKVGILSRLLNVLSAIVGPAIPIIMCSGLVSALLIIMTKAGLSPKSDSYAIMQIVGNAALYFLPVFLAYTSAQKFGCDTMTSVLLSGIMISPSLIAYVGKVSYLSLFGLPVKAVDYTSSLIPIILTIWVFSYVEKLIIKIVPNAVKFVFKPLLSILIMTPIMLCVTGPLGSYCGDLLNKLMMAINTTAPWASVLVVGCLAPVLVLTGMHLALIPLVLMMFKTVGYDNMLFVAFIGMNFSQFGVAMACLLKSKNKNLRTLATSCAITSFLAGVTEPTLYGICIRMKKPLIATWIACAANAIFCAVFSVRVYSFGAPSFFTMPIFLNPNGSMTNFYLAIAAAALTIIVSFAATWILGFDDSCYGESKKQAA